MFIPAIINCRYELCYRQSLNMVMDNIVSMSNANLFLVFCFLLVIFPFLSI